MRTQHAVRNIRLCTKDCLCLYICPVGATDTENGQVDWDKCIGCGKCEPRCPYHLPIREKLKICAADFGE